MSQRIADFVYLLYTNGGEDGSIIRPGARDNPKYFVKYREADGTQRMKLSKQPTKEQAKQFLASVEARISRGKIVQSAVAEVLSAIYEADFLGLSYGFRPRRGPHDALSALHTAMMSLSAWSATVMTSSWDSRTAPTRSR